MRNVWYLLLYSWDLAEWKGHWQNETETSPTLLALLARILAATVRDLLRAQLARSFVTHSETIRGIRGRIEMWASVRRLEFEAGRAHCSFPQLGVDTLRNRIIKYTLSRLANAERLDPEERADIVQLRSEIRALVRALDGVELVPISTADFGKLQLGRSDRAYAVPLAICRLLHQLELPTESAGDHAIVALIEDELRMPQVYETFIRNFYRVHLSDHDVRSEKLLWPNDLPSGFMPEMRTDVTITASGPRARRIVVDAKFSTTTLATGPHGSAKFKSENLYQLYTYLRTQEHRGDAFRAAEGMLLYPTTAHVLTESVLVQGHRIQVATLPLSSPWTEIESRLIALVRAPTA